ncbi:MAG TPA: hypothetical protein PLU94_06040 [Methanoregulaceae archaeon]|nr:hypothetical protein [Methanoregulaceae archaeon]
MSGFSPELVGYQKKLQIIRDSTVNRSLQLSAVMVLPAGAWWL